MHRRVIKHVQVAAGGRAAGTSVSLIKDAKSLAIQIQRVLPMCSILVHVSAGDTMPSI